MQPKMCKCGDCVYWSQEHIAVDDLGYCCVSAPTVSSSGDTCFPLTKSDIRCADGWDGALTEQQKAAEAYFQGQADARASSEKMDS